MKVFLQHLVRLVNRYELFADFHFYETHIAIVNSALSKPLRIYPISVSDVNYIIQLIIYELAKLSIQLLKQEIVAQLGERVG